MGMYTGLRGIVRLNAAGLKAASKNFDWENCEHDALRDFGRSFSRASFIPFGQVCYMHDGWLGQYSTVEGNIWAFCCSLKNYTGEIQYFIDNVLPHMADAWSLESRYEESEHSQFYVKE